MGIFVQSQLVPIIPFMDPLTCMLYEYHYIDLNGKYITCQQCSACQLNKSYIILSEYYECILLSLLWPMDHPASIGKKLHR